LRCLLSAARQAEQAMNAYGKAIQLAMQISKSIPGTASLGLSLTYLAMLDRKMKH